jgi:hypothetical protein
MIILHMVIRDQSFMERVAKATLDVFDGNPQMGNVFYGAPTLIMISSNLSVKNDNEFSLIPTSKMAGIDIASAACIADTMLVAATDVGLASIYLCAFVEGFNNEPDLIKELGLPDGFRPLNGILLDYSDAPKEELKLEISLRVNYK